MALALLRHLQTLLQTEADYWRPIAGQFRLVVPGKADVRLVLPFGQKIGSAEVCAESDSETMKQLLLGLQNPQQLFLEKRLQITGEVPALLQFNCFLEKTRGLFSDSPYSG